MMMAKLINYFSKHNGIEDIEYLNGVVYISTIQHGVYGYELSSNGESACYQNPFRAIAIETWGDSLVLIGEKENRPGTEAVFQIIDTKTNKTAVKSVDLPQKNYLTKHARKTFTGKEVITSATETSPWLRKAVATNDKLYILYLFAKEHPVIDGKNIKYTMEYGKEAILCVYSLPELELINHYKLGSAAFIFNLRYPYIIYNSVEKRKLINSINLTTGQIISSEISVEKDITSLACDRDFIYVGYGTSSDDSKLSILKVSDLSFVEEIDLIEQMSAVNRFISEEYNKVLGDTKLDSYPERLKKADDYYRKLYVNSHEFGGFIRAANSSGENFASSMDMFSYPERNVLAVATEIGTNPGFLWDTQTRQPITHLFGHSTVSRSIKIRYPYVLSRAFEDAHIWELS